MLNIRVCSPKQQLGGLNRPSVILNKKQPLSRTRTVNESEGNLSATNSMIGIENETCYASIKKLQVQYKKE